MTVAPEDLCFTITSLRKTISVIFIVTSSSLVPDFRSLMSITLDLSRAVRYKYTISLSLLIGLIEKKRVPQSKMNWNSDYPTDLTSNRYLALYKDLKYIKKKFGRDTTSWTYSTMVAMVW